MPREDNQVEVDRSAASEAASNTASEDFSALSQPRARRIQAAFEPVLREEITRLRRARRTRALFAFAAVLVIVVGAALFRARTMVPETVALLERSTGAVQLVPARSPSQTVDLRASDEIPAGATLRTGAGVRAALDLAMGGSLRLDAESEVVLVSESSISLLRGALYVDSGTGGSRSPSVDTPLGKVTPIGTQFELRIEGGGVTIKVREGAVRVDAGVGPVEARRSEELALRDDGGVTRDSIALHGEAWEWVVEVAPTPARSGTLADYLVWLQREMGWRLSYSEPSLAEEARTIELQLPSGDMMPMQMLPILLEASELGYRLAEDLLIIEPKSTV